ncbi:MAG: pyridoxamine 5'-phosphate oxidase family protein [Acidimicrobiales bacterium]
MTPLSDPVREVLEGPYLAHLVTLNPDGSPQATVVWVGLEDNEVIAGHLGSWKKVRNLRRDPRVVISLETGRPGPHGLAESWSTGPPALPKAALRSFSSGLHETT